MRDALTAWIRTVVPAGWAAVVAWLVSLGLPPEFADQLSGLAGTLIVPGALAVVYAVLRKIEPHVPSWLAVLLLGSAKTPTYQE